MITINQDELKQQIETLKKKASEAKAKAEGKTSDPTVRKARKQVKRAQRKLRTVKSYKASRKKKDAA